MSFITDDAWILDIVHLRWTKLDHFANCNPHLWHTACKTHEGEVLVFGGCTNNILSEEENQVIITCAVDSPIKDLRKYNR